MPVSKETLDEIALREEEYNLIVEKLGREPNALELGMFGALWSEHCGYKHSKLLLKKFPTKSSRVLVGPGEENAGAVDIGDGLAIVFKIESHNHPSPIEPFQGAATGVGGIVRDIFTMGARPIALLNSLRFGPLHKPRNRFLFNGVVGGVSWYGNCIGVPDVGGEIYFEECYSHNPLVNALCVGIIEKGKIVRARTNTKEAGPPKENLDALVILIGAETGKDGIHGASGLASRTFSAEGGSPPEAYGPRAHASDGEEKLRPTVQVGNPFLQKVLIEACFEIIKIEGVIGMQDLGAAGLTSSSVEMAHRGNTGIDLDVTLVPRRQADMSAYEVMLSESQERMLVIVKPAALDEIMAIAQKWDIGATVIGRVIEEPIARIREGEHIEAELPTRHLIEAPRYSISAKKPYALKRRQILEPHDVPLPPKENAAQILLTLLASPNITSKHSVWTQYDHQVGTNTILGPGKGDAAVLRIKGSKKGIAITTDGNGRLCFLNPYDGGAIAVAEACRNLVCVGAKPIAITDCLNFGDPEKPEVAYQLKECIRGMARALRILNVPVVSGNVSLYNATRQEAIYPTPVVGALGLFDNVANHCTPGFKDKGDIVILVGSDGQEPFRTLGASEYLKIIHKMVNGKPTIDLKLEKKVQKAVLYAIKRGLIKSAHDCSDGGLLVALAECCILGNIGFQGDFPLHRSEARSSSMSGPLHNRWDAVLFGEAQSRIVVSVASEKTPLFIKLLKEKDVPHIKLGVVEDGRLIIKELIAIPIDELSNVWYDENGLANGKGLEEKSS